MARVERSPFNVGLAERAAGRATRAAGDEAASEAHLCRALEAFLPAWAGSNPVDGPGRLVPGMV